MRTLAIGDIHGCLDALETLVDFVGLSDDDRLITLGDYVDKGPDSAGVLDWLVSRNKRSQLVALRGNHDLMMLEARDDDESQAQWMLCGGPSTLASYGKTKSSDPLGAVPKRHWKFLNKTRLFYETKHHFFVHGNVYPDLPLHKQPDYMLMWEKFYDVQPHRSGKTMVCGHTSQKDGQVNDVGHAICIDTWACGDGWLTCLDVDSGEYWQANQAGKTKSGNR